MLRNLLLFLSRQKKAEHWLMAFPGATKVASQFVAGDTLAKAIRVVRSLNQQNLLATLDHLGENVTTLEEAARARNDYMAILEEISLESLPSTISVKLTQLGLDLSETACRSHLFALTERTEGTESFLQVDMEDSAHTDSILRIVSDTHRTCPVVGAVIQAYLYRSEQDVQRLLSEGIRIRLCKGAYKEPSSIAYPHKADVDANYMRLTQLLLQSRLYHSIATHDQKIIDLTRQYAIEIGVPKHRYEFQMLFGVRRDLQQQLVSEGYRVRIYVPFGKDWFPYFMRRLAERPANLAFVTRNLFH